MRILSELDNSKYEEQAEEIHQALLNCDYELLPRINPKILHEVAEKVYEESNKSLGELVSMMEHTHIGSPDRIRLGYLAAEGSHLPDHDLKRIFNFRFLSGEGSRKMPWEDAIRKEDNLESYLMIRSNLLELAKEKSLEWLQKLAA